MIFSSNIFFTAKTPRRQGKNIFKILCVFASLRLLFFTFYFLLFTFGIHAQSFLRWDTLKVKENSTWLKNAWAGGFNNPQFSEIDLDNDGKKDLFIFDRSTSRVLTFLNKGDSGQVNYIYVSDYQNKFPVLKDWALLVDYDCDGREDIFTSASIQSVNGGLNTGIAVYHNDYNSTKELHFSLVSSLLLYDGTPFIYVSPWNIPAIADVDGDGDIDILNYDIFGFQMQYYKNTSVEKYGKCDSLIYTLAESCWGKFVETGNAGKCDVLLDSCGYYKTQQIMHFGSTLLAMDVNGDSTQELIVGGGSCGKLYMLTNGGTTTAAKITNYNPAYPTAYPAAVNTMPAAFAVDVNNDGLKDLIAAPNGLTISEDATSAWYYQNKGTQKITDFVFQKNNFLQDEMIDVGKGAYPVFFNYDGDSLLDLVIGNYDYYQTGGNLISSLTLYKNIGTKSAPAFELITRNYCLLDSLKRQNIYPAFGDLDGDGDMDMLIGENGGHLYYFENNAGAGKTANFILKDKNYNNIDVGQSSTPQLVDVDRDGKLDLLIGNNNGQISYYHNSGSKTNPDFKLLTNSFGGVDVKNGLIAAHSIPFLAVIDTGRKYTLFVGAEDGTIHQYTNIDNNLTGKFTEVDTILPKMSEGTKISISGGDIDQNGTVDLAIGSYGGGAVLYKNTNLPVPPIPPAPPEPQPFSVTIAPNPLTDYLKITTTGTSPDDAIDIGIFNMLGQRMYAEQFKNNLSEIQINFNSFSKGLYFCKVTVTGKQNMQKVQKMVVTQ